MLRFALVSISFVFLTTSASATGGDTEGCDDINCVAVVGGDDGGCNDINCVALSGGDDESACDDHGCLHS